MEHKPEDQLMLPEFGADEESLKAAGIEPAETAEHEKPLSDFDHSGVPMGLLSESTPWLDWMKRHIGQSETGKHGHKSNPWIVSLFKHTTYKTTSDQTPWCAATVCTALEECGYKSTKSAAAASYLHYGTPCEVKPGAIVVFKWKTGHHHVGFVVSVDKNHVAALGGNQSDKLKVSIFSKAYIQATRWPVK